MVPRNKRPPQWRRGRWGGQSAGDSPCPPRRDVGAVGFGCCFQGSHHWQRQCQHQRNEGRRCCFPRRGNFSRVWWERQRFGYGKGYLSPHLCCRIARLWRRRRPLPEPLSCHNQPDRDERRGYNRRLWRRRWRSLALPRLASANRRCCHQSATAATRAHAGVTTAATSADECNIATRAQPRGGGFPT